MTTCGTPATSFVMNLTLSQVRWLSPRSKVRAGSIPTETRGNVLVLVDTDVWPKLRQAQTQQKAIPTLEMQNLCMVNSSAGGFWGDVCRGISIENCEPWHEEGESRSHIMGLPMLNTEILAESYKKNEKSFEQIFLTIRVDPSWLR